MSVSSEEFEARTWEMIQPVEGKNGRQLPRPWFTAFDNPLKARVFTVGANQKNGYDPAKVDIERHFNSLFNRNGQSCASVYKDVVGKESGTRQRIQQLITGKLQERGIRDVLETNIICRSSRRFSDLDATERSTGSEIFGYLMRAIRPKLVITYGKGVRKEFAKWVTKPADNWKDLDTRLERIFPNEHSEPTSIFIDDGFEVFCIRGLSIGGWAEWSGWADSYTFRLADAVAHKLNS